MIDIALLLDILLLDCAARLSSQSQLQYAPSYHKSACMKSFTLCDIRNYLTLAHVGLIEYIQHISRTLTNLRYSYYCTINWWRETSCPVLSGKTLSQFGG